MLPPLPDRTSASSISMPASTPSTTCPSHRGLRVPCSSLLSLLVLHCWQRFTRRLLPRMSFPLRRSATSERISALLVAAMGFAHHIHQALSSKSSYGPPQLSQPRPRSLRKTSRSRTLSFYRHGTRACAAGVGLPARFHAQWLRL